MELTLENVSSENPATSVLAAMSIIATLRDLTDELVFLG
jgi:predicted dinucleotide-utilizing enzyme